MRDKLSKDKLSLEKLFENKQFLIVFALVMSVMLYFTVAMVNNDTITYTIHNVPVNLDLQAANLTSLQLYVVEGEDQTVDVEVLGSRKVVGQLTASSEMLATTAKISEITSKGKHSIQVVSAVNTDDLPFTIVNYSKSRIEVELDRMKKASFTIAPITKGVSSPPGYFYEDAVVTPNVVNVTGPEAEISKIASAEIELELAEPLDHTYARDIPIVLKDAQGNAINIDEKHVTIDVTEAQLVITVLTETGLPLEVDFLTPPRNFPAEDLREYMTMSSNYVMIAGPSDVIERLTEIHLGYIDIKELRPENSAYSFSVALDDISNQIISLDNINSVTVEFDTSDWDSNNFTLSNITPINVPLDKDVKIVSTQINDVEIVGTRAAMENITADDIVAELDLSEREITSGQYNYPVKISVPGAGLVWATGSHNVTIQVSDKEN